jgi:hypothetical protein
VSALRWSRVRVVERERRYTDHVAGLYRIAEGYDERERRAGLRWALFHRDRFVGLFPSVALARSAAESEAR